MEVLVAQEKTLQICVKAENEGIFKKGKEISILGEEKTWVIA